MPLVRLRYLTIPRSLEEKEKNQKNKYRPGIPGLYLFFKFTKNHFRIQLFYMEGNNQPTDFAAAHVGHQKDHILQEREMIDQSQAFVLQLFLDAKLPK